MAAAGTAPDDDDDESGPMMPSSFSVNGALLADAVEDPETCRVVAAAALGAAGTPFATAVPGCLCAPFDTGAFPGAMLKPANRSAPPPEAILFPPRPPSMPQTLLLLLRLQL